jgi:hypothetical protein
MAGNLTKPGANIGGGDDGRAATATYSKKITADARARSSS